MPGKSPGMSSAGGEGKGAPSLAPVLYLPDKLIVRVFCQIDRRVAYAVADEIEHGLNYYGYRHTEVQLDSPGGDALALSYLVDRFSGWKEKGVVLETLGLGRVASAAAILLSLGSHGHRGASARAMLLYHSPRVSAASDVTWTKEALESAALTLTESERLILDALIESTDSAQRGARERLLSSLLKEERWLTPTEAVEFELIDYIQR